jgi:hypothetical protein
MRRVIAGGTQAFMVEPEAAIKADARPGAKDYSGPDGD